MNGALVVTFAILRRQINCRIIIILIIIVSTEFYTWKFNSVSVVVLFPLINQKLLAFEHYCVICTYLNDELSPVNAALQMDELQIMETNKAQIR